MDYLKIYNQLVTIAGQRPEPSPKEVHHIVPRSLGGTDHPSNLVALTPREHCLAHMLLRKIYPDFPEMRAAWNFMCSQGTKAYVIKRAKVIEQATGRYVSSYTCAKISARARWAATPVIQIEPVTGNILAVYRSPMDAGESISSPCFRKNDLISTCARLNLSDGNKTSLGFIWRYKH